MAWTPDSRLTDLLASTVIRSLQDFREALSRATAALKPDHAKRGIVNTGVAATHTWKSVWLPRLESLPARLGTVARDVMRDYGHEITPEVAAWLTEQLGRRLQELEAGLLSESASLFPFDGTIFPRRLRDLLQRMRARVAADLRDEGKRTELRGEGRLDPAFSILNRSAFDDDSAEAFRQASRKGAASMALFMVDMDNLKRLNDTHGHSAGHNALAALADRLNKAASSRRGKAYRIGGDEFVVVAPLQEAGDPRALAEELRAAVDSPPLTTHTDVPVGVSIGVAVAPAEVHDAKDWFELADRRMYEDKIARKAGR
jgi:diguanylate cyclase (GGDEF)-like protein